MTEEIPRPTMAEAKLKLPERRLIRRLAKGEFWRPLHMRGNEPDPNPAHYRDWGSDRTISAELIRHLALGGTVSDEHGDQLITSTEPLLISGARIAGCLSLRGVTLRRDIWLEQCAFDNMVQLSDSKTKTVSLLGSHLSGGLRAKRATVKGSLYLNNGFRSREEVNLEDITIEGNLECSNGEFRTGELKTSKYALIADNAKIGGDVRLSFDKEASSKTCFEARGDVRFVGAKVSGDFDCSGGKFHNAKATALEADGLLCRNLDLGDDFEAEGTVTFIGVRTQGQVECIGGTFSNEDGQALCLRYAAIGSALLFHKSKEDTSGAKPASIHGILDLSQAKCIVYRDSPESWPPPGKLLLDGFTYERFHDCPTDWRTRQNWLKLQKPDPTHGTFHPQPWTQAIKVLHDTGSDSDSRLLAVRREAALARSNRWTISLGRGTEKHHINIFSLWDVFLRIAVGYGYKPWRALYWSLGFFAFGWLTFATAANLGYMVPRESSAQIYLAGQPGDKQKPDLPGHYTEFNAPLYALDIYLPIIELGQDQAWEPSDTQTGYPRKDQVGWWAVNLALGQDWHVTDAQTKDGQAAIKGLAVLADWTYGIGLHRVVYWLMVVLGWIFVSLFIAGMSGIMKRE